jgi:hypothetical protein
VWAVRFIGGNGWNATLDLSKREIRAFVLALASRIAIRTRNFASSDFQSASPIWKSATIRGVCLR